MPAERNEPQVKPQLTFQVPERKPPGKRRQPSRRSGFWRRQASLETWQIAPEVLAFQERIRPAQRIVLAVAALWLLVAPIYFLVRGHHVFAGLSMSVGTYLIAVPLMLVARVSLQAETARRARSIPVEATVVGLDQRLLHTPGGAVPVLRDVPRLMVTTHDGRAIERSPRPSSKRLQVGDTVAVLHDPETDQVDLLHKQKKLASLRSYDISTAISLLVVLVVPQVAIAYGAFK